MSYIQEYISDSYEEVEDLQSLYRSMTTLGFDPEVKPNVFSHYQITEGLEIYDEIKLHFQAQGILNDQPVFFYFKLRAIRDENQVEFLLNDIEAKLSVRNGDRLEEIASQSYGSPTGFSSKERMIQELSEKALQLAEASLVKERFGIGSVAQSANHPLRRKI